jgi:predicted AAA+ superfamily ATPase
VTPELLDQLKHILDRVERLLDRQSPEQGAIDWSSLAFRWQAGQLRPVARFHRVELDDLLCVERQKAEVLRNTRQFVAGRPANNILLWGSRGTGKSSLIKAVFGALADQGLRLIELPKDELGVLPELGERLAERPERFIIYSDDLSFEADDPGYKSLKAALEGSISEPPDNILIYATSNRRHLLPEFQSDNQHAKVLDGELHLGDGLEEKISLADRFGLRLGFRPFSQDDYLQLVDHWLAKEGLPGTDDEATRLAAIRWASQNGGRSGRAARHFAIDWLGQVNTPA